MNDFGSLRRRTSDSSWQWLLMGTFLGLGFAMVVCVGGYALGGITFASLWEKRFGLSHHPVTANLVGYAAGLVGVLPLMLWLDSPEVNWTFSFIAALAYLVIGNSVIAVGLLLAMIRAGEVSKVSTLLFLVPPLATLLAWLAIDEVMPTMAWVGLVVSGAVVLLATRTGRAAQAPKT